MHNPVCLSLPIQRTFRSLPPHRFTSNKKIAMANEKTPTEAPRWLLGFYLVAGIAAVLALALGLWDVVVERDGEADLVMSILLPLALLILVIALYKKRRGQAAP